MFVIEKIGLNKEKRRLVSSGILTAIEFNDIANALGVKSFRARKVGFVAARRIDHAVQIETHWNGRESTDIARPGDHVVTSLTSSRQVLRDRNGGVNQYIIRADAFPELYEPVAEENEFGQIFKSKNMVDAIFLSGGFDLLAPWGEAQVAPEGYLIMNGTEVYGNNAETFEASYEVLN